MKYLGLLITAIIILVAGCSDRHLINDREYLKIVENAFSERRQVAENRKESLFDVFGKNLTIRQEEALKFLFAFMPLNDLADYSGEFFLANINMSFKAIEDTPWGSAIPEDIFLNYVLPVRVNTENLDSFRIIYYDEILNRVKGKNITEAALEINHWCHEKVTYQPSDSRTSAPLSTILSARGRCGEESVFTVAALRTAGIPARQVYTPRWAHMDDNHAWVEVWINGEWKYMGACEPEPVLDRGWFTEPARRAMLVDTKSFGAYSGNENIINQYEKYTEVNNLSKYAVTKKIYVTVLDRNGKPVKDAMVEYQLYNSAEFYPLAIVPTDENGFSSFETGLGDLLIWGRKNDDFDFRKISVIETDTLVLNLVRKAEGDSNFEFDMLVPVARSPFKGPTPELIAQNNQKLDNENFIRQKYIDSWIKPEEAKALALQINEDTTKIMVIIARSMGNFRNIKSFLINTPDSLRSMAIDLLEIISEKDVRDTKEEILTDYLMNADKPDISLPESEKRLFIEYVLNPRVANEKLLYWYSNLFKVLPAELKTNASEDPSRITSFLNENIIIADSENYYRVPITPAGVLELKVADTKSRSICFVAICRSLGIPARLEPGSNVPQYFQGSEWHDVYFSDQKAPSLGKGYLRLISSENNPVPEYYIHFTIARFENGRYNTLEYEYNKRINDFKEDLQLTPGHYMLVTGNRLNDSKILSDITFFDLRENEHKTINVRLRKDISPLRILGKIDLHKILNTIKSDTGLKSIPVEKGIVMLWIEPDKEPTKHIFNDLPLLKTELDAWGGSFLFLNWQSDNIKTFNQGNIKGLPENSVFLEGKADEILKIIEESGLRSVSAATTPVIINYPYIVFIDKEGNILFSSEGYRIGIGEQILKCVK